MKVVVIGTGAMGTLFGSRLARAGHDLTFIDTQGSSDPVYTGLGSRFRLVWVP